LGLDQSPEDLPAALLGQLFRRLVRWHQALLRLRSWLPGALRALRTYCNGQGAAKAEGCATEEELDSARQRVEQGRRYPGMANVACARDPLGFVSAHELWAAGDEWNPRHANYERLHPVPWRAGYVPILEDMVRPVSFSTVAAWSATNDPLAAALARRIYLERDFDALPVLGDALEDAGCYDPAILDHCRRPGPHWRGCWVLDLLLGEWC
jgi:hypothetical protein